MVLSALKEALRRREARKINNENIKKEISSLSNNVSLTVLDQMSNDDHDNLDFGAEEEELHISEKDHIIINI